MSKSRAFWICGTIAGIFWVLAIVSLFSEGGSFTFPVGAERYEIARFYVWLGFALLFDLTGLFFFLRERRRNAP